MAVCSEQCVVGSGQSLACNKGSAVMVIVESQSAQFPVILSDTFFNGQNIYQA